MKNSGSSIAKGIGVGMLVGGAMTIIGSSMIFAQVLRGLSEE